MNKIRKVVRRVYDLLVNRSTRFCAVCAVLSALAFGCRTATPKAAPATPSVLLTWKSSGGAGPLTYSIHQGGISKVYTNVIGGIAAKSNIVSGLKAGATLLTAKSLVSTGRHGCEPLLLRQTNSASIGLNQFKGL